MMALVISSLMITGNLVFGALSDLENNPTLVEPVVIEKIDTDNVAPDQKTLVRQVSIDRQQFLIKCKNGKDDESDIVWQRWAKDYKAAVNMSETCCYYNPKAIGTSILNKTGYRVSQVTCAMNNSNNNSSI